MSTVYRCCSPKNSRSRVEHVIVIFIAGNNFGSKCVFIYINRLNLLIKIDAQLYLN